MDKTIEYREQKYRNYGIKMTAREQSKDEGTNLI
jgi:hypothetical protein